MKCIIKAYTGFRRRRAASCDAGVRKSVESILCLWIGMRRSKSKLIQSLLIRLQLNFMMNIKN
ncbi:hypothetical protein CR158_18810 [Halomonas heilongjiangensis]|uniref:Uncharacterized protein n=1 Tax=Halomonas heilongjiangensis TaxID=1387883 RepID=A0A2N7TM79_9GAMM|nr:hypothetical protein C1H66_11650 [Halomonas heilongjiangensis]PXX87420.1 hypothetical protein CR158_18810 [Halomonas heilongjiangensis]